MRDLDDTDREILRLLLADARRPYADIADHVDLSPPAVSDRVDRLRELGVVRRFTVDLDRSRLAEGVDVLVELRVPPEARDAAQEALRSVEGVEHVFRTAEGELVFVARLPDPDVADRLDAVLDLRDVRELDVRLLADREWHPDLGDATLGLACAECGNTVTSEGVAATLDGERYEFCCTSCRDRFAERYERVSEDADA